LLHQTERHDFLILLLLACPVVIADAQPLILIQRLALPVIPAKAGIHAAVGKPEKLDSRFRGNDGVWGKAPPYSD
jgi:hypothetical protein